MKQSKTEVTKEILDWIQEKLETKNYGIFGIEVTLHEGDPVSIQKTERLNYRRLPDGIVHT